jgi:hypothetical protein
MNHDNAATRRTTVIAAHCLDNHASKISSKADFFESSSSESSLVQNKAKEVSMLYTITPEGKIRLHRDLSKWRKPMGKNEYYEVSQSPAEASKEKEFAALIARSTKELSLDAECAVAVKNMKKQDFLDRLVG